MSRKILLIQDDIVNAKVILEALRNSEDERFQVEWVRRCSEALDRLVGVAAILVDLFLPDSNGIETFDRLFKAAPKIPILVLIGPRYEETAKLAVMCGAQDYLFKTRVDAYLLPKALGSMIERAAIADALFDDKERAQVTLDSIGDAVVSTDVAGNVAYLNAVAEALSGWTNDEAVGHPLQDVIRIIDATTRETVQNPMLMAIRENRPVALAPNCVLIRRDGVEAAIEDSAAPIHDRRGSVSGAVMVLHDVSAARVMTLKMSYLAQYDSLTGLPNRALLHDRLHEALALSKRHRRQLAVLFLDLDRFKHINDSLGYTVGDGLLQSVGRRLSGCVRDSDTVSRLGGDEFVVLLWEVKHAQDPAITAENILQALREPHQIMRHELHITGSIGIVAFPDDGTDAETLLKKADVAMYRAKESGRDSYQFFKPETTSGAMRRQSLAEGLRHASERREMSVHYQPKMDLATGTIIGVEALTRWSHPQRGLVPAAQFIRIAEECGLIVPIGRWVLREACRQARAWQSAGLAPMSVAVNISAAELRSPGFIGGVRTILRETALEPRCLELELTEAILTEDSPSVAEVLKALKDLGVLLALDDFGTGCSSLAHLRRVPMDCLKIDRSLVRNLTTDDDDASIVTAMIGMGKSLRMRVVAEGVETREQLAMLREYDCPQAQGYYFSPAVPATDLGDMLMLRQSP